MAATRLEIAPGEEIALVDLKGHEAAGRAAIVPWREWQRLRRAFGSQWYVRTDRRGREMVVTAPTAPKRHRKDPGAKIARPIAQILTLAAPHEVAEPLHGPFDLRPSSWRCRNVLTGQVRRGDHFGFGIPIAA